MALVDGQTVIAQSSILRKGGHGPGVLDDLHHLLEEVGMVASEVDGFVVGLGPGSFTGLRIGLATLKGLALAYSKPIYGALTSAMLIQASSSDNAVAVIDARRGEVYLEGGDLQAPVCCAPEEIWRHVGTDKAWCFVGDGALKYQEVIRSSSHPCEIPDADEDIALKRLISPSSST